MIVNKIIEDMAPKPYYVRGVFAHYCYDWDGLAISEWTPEFSSCLERWRGWRGVLFPLVKWLNEKYWLWGIERRMRSEK